ncbi:5,10-methylenetetrahydrofolate reductase [Buchnera aphidicola (Melanaphis sacchari)]|uniref:Methylenetetrahydrofolate reductase n=1 Tax=Buchnera aphidicola (Melanaphis sacchari) TaxID=2173854 RepID=A0A2U8DHK5_9GAMM|nr:methylenetetrahydrofolate reductase [Buchnera aphidicola]AWH90712.1 5,10-methylenetetrahydrofolate reductase [Buchnera aphidicola (Melanaphis sacchari)]
MNFLNKHYQETIHNRLESLKNTLQFSFEFFPPKNIDLENKLYLSILKLIKLNPSFFSVTHGANNGEEKKTYEIVQKIYKKTGVITAPHLTCVNNTPIELEKIARLYWKSGIRNIVALRGDAKNKMHKHIMYAADLVTFLKKIADFDISVAAYPERHPESDNMKDDILNLKKKIDAGANRAITQFFFNIDSYLNFRDQCIKNGINVEIIPGILPIYNFQQLKKFSTMTNVTIPKWIFKMFNKLEDDLTTQRLIGVNILIDIVKKLFTEGVKNFHFYSLNKSDVVYSTCYFLKSLSL